MCTGERIVVLSVFAVVAECFSWPTFSCPRGETSSVFVLCRVTRLLFLFPPWSRPRPLSSLIAGDDSGSVAAHTETQECHFCAVFKDTFSPPSPSRWGCGSSLYSSVASMRFAPLAGDVGVGCVFWYRGYVFALVSDVKNGAPYG